MFDIEYLCGGKGPFVYECEYVKECNDKIDFTTINDIASGRYGYCVRVGGKCMRDDGEGKMSEAVRKMTREELIVARDKYKAEADRQYQNKCKLECQINEMQFHIDCLKAELAEIQMNKQELPEESIKIADMLIDKHIERLREFDRSFSEENAGMVVLGTPTEEFRQTQVSKLRQIAEHLLVYCNHAEVE